MFAQEFSKVYSKFKGHKDSKIANASEAHINDKMHGLLIYNQKSTELKDKFIEELKQSNDTIQNEDEQKISDINFSN